MTEVTTKDTEKQAPPPDRPGRRTDVVAALFRFQSLFGLVAVFVVAVVFSPHYNGEILFLTSENLFNVVRAVSEIGIMAVGMTFVILVGGIDLSVGAVLGLAAVGSAVLMVDDDLGVAATVVIVLLIGLFFGFLQGMASALFGIQAFIVTLAGMQIARGLARIWSGGQGVAIALVPIPALIFSVVAVVAIVFLRTSAFSRHVYAIGGNEKAARLSGVPVNRVKVIVFCICGFLAALSGIVHAGQLNQGSPNDGFGYELDAIAAVVIGGTSLSGGRGSVVGTVAGALLLGVLNNFLGLHGVDPNVQLLVKGLVIVVAAGLQRLRPTV